MAEQATDWLPPNDAALKAEALRYLRECKPALYRQMKRDGELEEYLAVTVQRCKNTAESYIRCGVWPRQAWIDARREVLLESPPD